MSASIPTPGRRTAYTEGLRRLADWLDAHPDIPLPYHGQDPDYQGPISIYYFADDQVREHMADAARAFPGPMTKRVDSYSFRLLGQLGGVHVQLIGWRSDVCERRVLGTREVTETVPDPDAPKVTVTRTEDVVEWVCPPLLDRDADR